MKKLIILSAITMSGLFYNTANAQIRVHLGFGFGPRRVIYTTAPVVVEQAPVYEQSAPVYNENAQVYDNNNDDYYYLPDVGAYYDVTAQCYYYNDGANWVSAAYLPGEYRSYDWRNARRFEVRASRPYLHDDFYRSRFNGRETNAFANNNYNRNRDEHFDNRNQGYNEHFDNHRQEAFNRPVYQNNAREWGNRGGNEHFIQANQRGGNENHRAFRF
ncbi:hypothetical protein HDF24_16160 [Mucilaginibacter sp. X4EP1]|uniref:hypothetical protein n=1 Tax=Mucilaginibacter sp. X4EP1 TaxID=2723092 RepID=UPI002169257A|nr:hypothetical protein [Mucilaginibacter sp. X4EP1]MCS3814897.1 hypothetical protein [Mucilaginibacter sp. X4EP1]